MTVVFFLFTLTMPTLLAAARHAKTAASPFDLLMQSNPTSTILTAQSPALLGSPFDLEGEPQNISYLDFSPFSCSLYLVDIATSKQQRPSFPARV
jgi:hypothetical protein